MNDRFEDEISKNVLSKWLTKRLDNDQNGKTSPVQHLIKCG